MAVASRAGQKSTRPVLVDVVAVDDVLEDVGLGQPDVLEQVPGRVLDVRRERVDRVVGEVGDSLVERHPGADPVEEGDELTAQAVRVGIGHRILGGRVWAAPS